MQPDVDSNDTLLLKDASPKSPSRVPPLRSMKRTPVADGRCRVPSPPLTPRLVASTTACHLGALYRYLRVGDSGGITLARFRGNNCGGHSH